jgi:hypothetical protein
VENDTAILARIYGQTVNQLDSFSKRVQEGRDVEAASDFARWLSFSGICLLLERYPNQVQSHHPLKVDGSFLRWKCEQLIEACNERFRTNSLNPAFAKKEFESMHEKIDRMAVYLSKLTAARTINVEPMPEPQTETSEPINDDVLNLAPEHNEKRQVESPQPPTFKVIQGGLCE